MPNTNRRNFLGATVLGMTGLGTLLSESRSSVAADSTATKRPVRIGAPTFFPEDDPQAWAVNARQQRYRAVYAPHLNADQPDRIRAFAQATQENDLVIAEVGRWCNLMDADSETREKNIQNMIDGLVVADELGARCCVNIPGSFSPTEWFGPHPGNFSPEFFDLVVENARKIIDAANPKRAKMTFEMMGWSIPNTPDRYLELIKAIDREAFAVHVDICNMISSPEKFWGATALIDETFDKLGPWIQSVHAKDLKWVTEMNIHFVECALGEGIIDHRRVLARMATLPVDAPLMIEHMKDQQEYHKCRDYLFEVAPQAGVALEWV